MTSEVILVADHNENQSEGNYERGSIICRLMMPKRFEKVLTLVVLLDVVPGHEVHEEFVAVYPTNEDAELNEVSVDDEKADEEVGKYEVAKEIIPTEPRRRETATYSALKKLIHRAIAFKMIFKIACGAMCK